MVYHFSIFTVRSMLAVSLLSQRDDACDFAPSFAGFYHVTITAFSFVFAPCLDCHYQYNNGMSLRFAGLADVFLDRSAIACFAFSILSLLRYLNIVCHFG